MWLSNSATTAMMLPIANAILESLFGDLEKLKERCKITDDPEGMQGRGYNQAINYVIAVLACVRMVSCSFGVIIHKLSLQNHAYAVLLRSILTVLLNV